MAYTITPDQAASITDVEIAFSTERLLPAWDEIPAEFKRGNAYTKLAEALLFGRPLPDATIEMRDGHVPKHMDRAVRAHLQSFAPKLEHKVAGVGLMIASMCVLSGANANA